MILICGIPTEPPLVSVCSALNDLDQSYVLFNQRAFRQNRFILDKKEGILTGKLLIEGRSFPLNSFSGVFLRLMDYRELSEFIGERVNSRMRENCAQLHEILLDWFEQTEAVIINKPSSMGSNGSKPYQAQLIVQAGLKVPETLVTNNPKCVLEFINQYDRVIYKSMSGVRSIVKSIAQYDLERLNDICWCPIQFQQYIKGIDVRVHTVGKKLFATAIESNRIDYRYPENSGDTSPIMSAFELDNETAEKCLNLAQSLGLNLSGIDLKITDEGQVYCLEINPCPGFSHFESQTGQPISQSIAQFLANSSHRI